MVLEWAAVAVVFGFGAFLLTLTILLVFVPERATGFFHKFATSAFTHFLEMFLRILVGASLVICSQRMQFAIIFYVFGWMLIATSAVLALLPWRWHNKFANLVLPPILKFPKLLAIQTAAMGIFVIYCLLRGHNTV